MCENWKKTTIGDIAEVVGGGTPSTKTEAYWGGDVVWLTPTEVVARDGGVVSDSERKITELGLKNSGAKILPPGTVVLTSRASVGFAAVAGCPLSTNQGFQSLIPSDEVDSWFLLYWVQQHRHMFESRSAGSTFKEISNRNVRTIPICLPPREVQRRIVDLVASVDAYIAGLEKQIEAARTARNAVLHDLLASHDRDTEEFKVSELLTRSIGGVWGKSAGEDQVDVTVVRSTEFTNKGILEYQTGVTRAITRNQLQSRELREGDILLEKSGGGPQQPVGRVVLVPRDIPPKFVCSNFVQLLSPNSEKVVPQFLFLVMWKWHLDGRTLEYQAQTTGIRNLRTPDYLDQSISVPSQAEQERIVTVISAMDDSILATEQVVEDTKRLRSGLLTGLLSGDHEIPESYDKFLGAA